MYVVFVTGALASGKQTVCNLLCQRGAEVIDLDAIAKEEQEHPSVLDALKKEFGADILTADGLDRSLLAKRAFASVEASDRLNAICWPPAYRRLSGLLHKRRAESTKGSEAAAAESGFIKSGLIVVEIPLLAEAASKLPELLNLADEIIVVEADEKRRLARAVKRGMDPTDASRRLALQESDEKRRVFATVVFDNNGTLESLEKQVESWYISKQHEHLFLRH